MVNYTAQSAAITSAWWGSVYIFRTLWTDL